MNERGNGEELRRMAANSVLLANMTIGRSASSVGITFSTQINKPFCAEPGFWLIVCLPNCMIRQKCRCGCEKLTFAVKN